MLNTITSLPFNGREILFDVGGADIMMRYHPELDEGHHPEPAEWVDLNHFLSSEAAVSLISAMEKDGLKRDSDIIATRKNDTWLHRFVALKIAASVSAEFEYWLHRSFDLLQASRAKYQYLNAREEFKTKIINKKINRHDTTD